MLNKLLSIKKQMEKLDWMIQPFIFSYKKVKYIVAIIRFLPNEEKNKNFAQVKLHFMKYNDFRKSLLCEVDKYKLIISAKELREFFGIEYSENLRDILQDFTNYLDSCVPDKINNMSEIEKKAALYSIKNLSDPYNINKIYCIGVKRNPEKWKRTDFNFDKARILVPKLFDYFKFDETISFCFSENKADEKSYEEIIRNFAKNRLN